MVARGKKEVNTGHHRASYMKRTLALESADCQYCLQRGTIISALERVTGKPKVLKVSSLTKANPNQQWYHN